ncbi:MAG TPA: hypothetical protein VFV98_15610 [Vicinamibacterales bacterium]|nr:hypothetical protein [Vicinamibacterales bacterium]
MILWTPRIAGLLMTVFLAAFALDAFNGAGPIPIAVLMHLLPAAIVGLAVAGGWRHPAFGAAAFLALAIGYAVMAGGHLDWIAVISGPLAFIALLFGVSAARSRRAQ